MSLLFPIFRSDPKLMAPWQNSERSKVIQSISSIIQALPPDEEIPPIEVLWLIFVLDY